MTSSSRHRPERLAALIQQEVADLLTTQVKDPRVGFVTVVGVTVAPDGQHALIRFSVLGDDEARRRAVEGLDSARGFLRSQLARRLTLRLAPELRFELDRGADHARRIDAILHQLKRDESDS